MKRNHYRGNRSIPNITYVPDMKETLPIANNPERLNHNIRALANNVADPSPNLKNVSPASDASFSNNNKNAKKHFQRGPSIQERPKPNTQPVINIDAPKILRLGKVFQRLHKKIKDIITADNPLVSSQTLFQNPGVMMAVGSALIIKQPNSSTKQQFSQASQRQPSTPMDIEIPQQQSFLPSSGSSHAIEHLRVQNSCRQFRFQDQMRGNLDQLFNQDQCDSDSIGDIRVPDSPQQCRRHRYDYY